MWRDTHWSKLGPDCCPLCSVRTRYIHFLKLSDMCAGHLKSYKSDKMSKHSPLMLYSVQYLFFKVKLTWSWNDFKWFWDQHMSVYHRFLTERKNRWLSSLALRNHKCHRACGEIYSLADFNLCCKVQRHFAHFVTSCPQNCSQFNKKKKVWNLYFLFLQH